jgi:hypothetical protein
MQLWQELLFPNKNKWTCMKMSWEKKIISLLNREGELKSALPKTLPTKPPPRRLILLALEKDFVGIQVTMKWGNYTTLVDSAHSLAKEQHSGIFNCSLDLAQEEHSLTAVNQPMVVGQGDVHHGSDNNLKQQQQKV